MIPFRRSVAILALVFSSPAAHAIDNAWTPLPFEAAAGPPYQVFLTSDPDIAYSFGATGLQRSEDGGRHWRQLWSPLAGSPVVDPADPDTLFLRSGSYLQRSDDGGSSWTLSWQSPDSTYVGVALFSRHFSGSAYLANGTALWRSSDGGSTFQQRGNLPGSPAASEIALEEAADGGLYLVRVARCGIHGCGSDWGVYRSADQGATWTPVEESGGNAAGRVEQAVAHPTRPETVYFRRRQTENPVERSDDRGATRIALASPVGFELCTDTSLPDALYLVGNGDLYRSLDRGASWQALTLPFPRENYHLADFSLASPGQVMIYRIGYTTDPPHPAPAFGSHDGGATWTAIPAEGLVAGYLAELAVAGPEGVLYVGTLGLGELRRSADGGATWETRSGAPRVYDDLVGDPLDGDTVFLTGRVGDRSGILRSRDGGRSFTLVAETDPFVPQMVAFVRGGATHVVALCGDGKIARSADGGDTWVVEVPQTDLGTPQYTTLEWDGQALYANGGGVFRSADGGATWQRLDQLTFYVQGGGGLLAYLDLWTNRIVSTADGGSSWASHPLPFPVSTHDRSLELEVDPRGQFYLRQYDVMLRSRDRGRTWQALAQDLPQIFYPHLAFDPQDPDLIYLGDDLGLFRGRFPGQPLALFRGRFEARLRWRTSPGAAWTEAGGAAITDQTGIFSPFSSERAEVAVQILDGRQQGGRFWVFVASMTDVELDLEILDRAEGEVWRHHQAAGQPRSLADLEAFPRLPQPTGGALPLPFGGDLAAQDAILAGLGLYEVRVTRPDPAGGEPIVVRGSHPFGDTAAFAFYNPQSLDLLVNVIDGRGINGKYWVFGGSLTDQEFDIEIRSILTGQVVWSRHHPAGSFAGFGDVNAF